MQRSLFGKLQAYLMFYRALARDPRTPGVSKTLPWLALLYFFMPLDFIPDFLPLLGQLDDLTIVPFLLMLAFWLIPKGVKQQNRREYIDANLVEK